MTMDGLGWRWRCDAVIGAEYKCEMRCEVECNGTEAKEFGVGVCACRCECLDLLSASSHNLSLSSSLWSFVVVGVESSSVINTIQWSALPSSPHQAPLLSRAPPISAPQLAPHPLTHRPPPSPHPHPHLPRQRRTDPHAYDWSRNTPTTHAHAMSSLLGRGPLAHEPTRAPPWPWVTSSSSRLHGTARVHVTTGCLGTLYDRMQCNPIHSY